jgi:hypothetical protein
MGNSLSNSSYTRSDSYSYVDLRSREIESKSESKSKSKHRRRDSKQNGSPPPYDLLPPPSYDESNFDIKTILQKNKQSTISEIDQFLDQYGFHIYTRYDNYVKQHIAEKCGTFPSINKLMIGLPRIVIDKYNEFVPLPSSEFAEYIHDNIIDHLNNIYNLNKNALSFDRTSYSIKYRFY